MKKTLQRPMMTAAIAALLAATTAACGSGSDSSADGGEKYKIAVIVKDGSTPFWIDVTDGAKAQGKKLDGKAEVTTSNGASQADYVSQINKVQSAITAGADAIVIAASSPQQLKPVLTGALKKGIKVVLIDDPIEGLDASTYIGTDNVTAGASAYKALSDAVGAEGEVAVIESAPGVTSVEDRVKGFEDAAKGGNLKIVSKLPTENCDQATGLKDAENILVANPDVVGIFAACGNAAVGAAEAIKAAGKGDQVKLIGFDANDLELDRIQKGEEYASVAQFPVKMGEMGVQAAYDILTGKSVESNIDTGSEIVTKDNVSDFVK